MSALTPWDPFRELDELQNRLATMSGHRIERAYGRFVRSFVLPDNVDPTKVTASMKDGVLEVRLVKAEQAKPKQIEISVN